MPHTEMPLGVTGVMLPELDFEEQLALLREIGVTHYSIRPRVIPDTMRDKPWSSHGNHKFDLTPKRLLAEATQLRQKLDAAGITPFGTLPASHTATDDEELKLNFEGAAAIGAGRVRVAPAPYPKGQFDYASELSKQVDRYGQIVELAQSFGQKVVIETHAYSLATSPGLAWNICRHFDAAHIGVIFDLANYQIEGAIQPALAVSILGDYIDHVHIGGSRFITTGYDENGFRKSGRIGCPVTESHLYLPDWIAALSAAGKAVPLIIEDFSPSPPGGERLSAAATALKRVLATM